jgi:hypothetical protein
MSFSKSKFLEDNNFVDLNIDFSESLNFIESICNEITNGLETKVDFDRGGILFLTISKVGETDSLNIFKIDIYPNYFVQISFINRKNLKDKYLGYLKKYCKPEIVFDEDNYVGINTNKIKFSPEVKDLFVDMIKNYLQATINNIL